MAPEKTFRPPFPMLQVGLMATKPEPRTRTRQSTPRRGCGKTACALPTGRIAIVELLDSSYGSPHPGRHPRKGPRGSAAATSPPSSASSPSSRKKKLVQRVAWIDGTTRHEIKRARRPSSSPSLSHLPHLPQSRADRRMRGGALRRPDRQGARLRRPKPLAPTLRRLPRLPETGCEVRT
jgi:hypothetical protein